MIDDRVVVVVLGGDRHTLKLANNNNKLQQDKTEFYDQLIIEV